MSQQKNSTQHTEHFKINRDGFSPHANIFRGQIKNACPEQQDALSRRVNVFVLLLFCPAVLSLLSANTSAFGNVHLKNKANPFRIYARRRGDNNTRKSILSICAVQTKAPLSLSATCATRPKISWTAAARAKRRLCF